VAADLDPSGLFERPTSPWRAARGPPAACWNAPPDLDAVFAASDPMAAGAMRTLTATGRRIPTDVAVVGFDDQPTLAPALTPPLTTVHQDPREQVRYMVRTLTALLAGQTVQPGTRILPVSMMHESPLRTVSARRGPPAA